MTPPYSITIFTPTFNRAYILELLYRSIQRQTFRDFEWLIVDDGSTDNTAELVQSWITEGNDFPIRYYKQENGGKCRAINRALDLAQGELFFTVDSDDYLTDDALERIAYWESTITNKPMYAGVVGNRGTSEKYSPNPPLGALYKDCNAFARYPEYTDDVIQGEHAEAWYTEVHRKYKYPEFPGENFMTEAVAWNRMANDGYKVRVFDEIIWICKYLDDGLTKAGSSVFVKNPHGYGLWLKEKAEFLGWSRKQILEMYYTFTCDLSPYYNIRTIAGCIGAPVWIVSLCRAAHTTRQKTKSPGIF